jgi:hypothetical protein
VLAVALGVVLLLEINYRLSTDAQSGGRMTLWRIAVDAATPWPWLAAAVLLVAGGFASRYAFRAIASAWERASDDAAAARARSIVQ